MKAISNVVFVGVCCSVLNFAGTIKAQQAVQQNTIDFSKAVPNAQGMSFLCCYMVSEQFGLDNTNDLYKILG